MLMINNRKKKTEKHEGIKITVPSNYEEMKEQLTELHTRSKTVKSMNETKTRLALIDPFVVSLGYNIYDSDIVSLEHQIKVPKKGNKKKLLTKHADYAILENGKPIVLIEAKSTGTKLKKDGAIVTDIADQIAMYFNNCPSVRVIILTNGKEYYFFTNDAKKFAKTSNPKTISSYEFLSFDLSNNNYVESLEALYNLVKSNFDLKPLLLDDVSKEVKSIINESWKATRAMLKAEPSKIPNNWVTEFRNVNKCPDMIDDDTIKAYIADSL